MNTKELIDLFNKTRTTIIEILYQDLTKGATLLLSESELQAFHDNSGYKIVNALYDMVVADSVYQENNIVDYFDRYDSFEFLAQDKLQENILDFYNANPKLLNDNFTLNNNFYFTDLRCFIVDLEDSLRQERQGK